VTTPSETSKKTEQPTNQQHVGGNLANHCGCTSYNNITNRRHHCQAAASVLDTPAGQHNVALVDEHMYSSPCSRQEDVTISCGHAYTYTLHHM
jgi:hypothetical protein